MKRIASDLYVSHERSAAGRTFSLTFIVDDENIEKAMLALLEAHGRVLQVVASAKGDAVCLKVEGARQ